MLGPLKATLRTHDVNALKSSACDLAGCNQTSGLLLILTTFGLEGDTATLLEIQMHHSSVASRSLAAPCVRYYYIFLSYSTFSHPETEVEVLHHCQMIPSGPLGKHQKSSCPK